MRALIFISTRRAERAAGYLLLRSSIPYTATDSEIMECKAGQIMPWATSDEYQICI